MKDKSSQEPSPIEDQDYEAWAEERAQEENETQQDRWS
jgi:hypothetical protein